MTPAETLRSGSAIVSGGGSGLGRALAHKLAGQGLPVAILGRRLDALEDTARHAPDLISAYACDVADPRAVRSAVARIAQKQGCPRILINNAAVYPRRDVLELPEGAFMQSVAINLGGTVHLTESVLPYMVKDGIGRIVNVATFADMSPLPMSAEYSTSKGAARIFTKALIADLADRFPDIVIGDWMPGMLATQMGIEDGLAPEIAAGWGAALALMHDPALTGAVFEMDREIIHGNKWKRRIKALLTLSKPPQARRITPI